jgi:hypothetical protein
VRTLLTPRWIVLHIIVLGTLPVVLWLGWWQWRGGFQGHSLQTTGYALQWWVFAAFAILLWLRLMRDELRRQDAAAAGGPPPGAAAPPEPRPPRRMSGTGCPPRRPRCATARIWAATTTSSRS